MFKSKKSKIISAIVAGTILFGGGLGSGVAAASGSTLKTQTVNEVLYNGRCYHYTSHTVTSYTWSSKAGRYLPSTPRVTDTRQDKCHS